MPVKQLPLCLSALSKAHEETDSAVNKAHYCTLSHAKTALCVTASSEVGTICPLLCRHCGRVQLPVWDWAVQGSHKMWPSNGMS